MCSTRGYGRRIISFLAKSLRKAVEQSGGLPWWHELPSSAPVDRSETIIAACAGRSVCHLGFVDEHQMDSKMNEGTWLHSRIAEVSGRLVGLDLEPSGVALAKELGYEAYAADAQEAEQLAALGLEPFDVIVAGEIIEHLDAPGPFLRGLHVLASDTGKLILTTPSAYRLANFLTPLSGGELVHPDHTAWHSPSTLRTLLERSGWQIELVTFYQNPRGARGSGWLKPVMNAIRKLSTAFGRRMPYWSDGILIVATPK
jgi:SAM-dependent methyltransferase